MSNSRELHDNRFDAIDNFAGPGGFLSPDANEEKHNMAFFLLALFEELQKQNVIFGSDKPLNWVEAGIGTGDSTRMFIEKAGYIHKPGYHIYGSDLFADVLTRASESLKATQDVPVTIAQMKQADAYKDEEFCDAHVGDIFFSFHMLYGAHHDYQTGRLKSSSEIQQVIDNYIWKGITALKPGGLSILFHETTASDMYERITRDDTLTLTDTPSTISKAADRFSKLLVELPVDSRVYFPVLPPETLERMKDRGNWEDYADQGPEASWLRKFLFLSNFCDQRQANLVDDKLGEAIDFVAQKLATNGGFIVIRSKLQAIVNDQAMQTNLQKAFRTISEQRTKIESWTIAAMATAKALGGKTLPVGARYSWESF